MIRRTFLGSGLMLVGFGRRAWAQLASGTVVYSRLTSPVRIPLDAVTTPWNAVSFKADAVLPAAAAVPGQQVRLDGVLLRTSTGDDSPERFTALCMICPHESCLVNFFNDPKDASELSDGATSDPVFSCGCHHSAFTASDGNKINGPTHRGLYRFRVTDVRDGTVVIDEVEEALLLA